VNALPRVNPDPYLRQEDFGFTVDELRDEVARLANASRAEFAHCGGPSKTLARLMLEWRRYLRRSSTPSAASRKPTRT